MFGSTLRLHLPALGTASLLALSTGIAAAQVPDWSEDWEAAVVIYGWLPSITGSQERQDGTPVVDLDAADVLSALDFAFMGSAEVRRGKIGLLFDLIYTDLSQDGKWLNERLRTEVGTELTMATAAVSYRLYEANEAKADVFAGARVYDVALTFDIRSNLFSRSLDADANWTDLLVGVRGAVPIGGAFSASGWVATGGFGIGSGSQSTWDVYGGVNYAFNDSVMARLGYRYMSIDYESSGLSMDIEMYGPMIGVGFSF